MDTNTVCTSAVIDTTNTENIPSNSNSTGNDLKLLCENILNINGTTINEKVYINTQNNSVKLFRNDIELTIDITDFIKEAYVYDNEYWSYKDANNFVHLFNNSGEMTKNIKTLGVLRHPQTGQWLYANDANRLALLQ